MAEHPVFTGGCSPGMLVDMHITIETEQEVDGRWLSEARQLPGVLTYGATRPLSQAKAEALALRVLAERLEASEVGPVELRVEFVAA